MPCFIAFYTTTIALILITPVEDIFIPYITYDSHQFYFSNNDVIAQRRTVGAAHRTSLHLEPLASAIYVNLFFCMYRGNILYYGDSFDGCHKVITLNLTHPPPPPPGCTCIYSECDLHWSGRRSV